MCRKIMAFRYSHVCRVRHAHHESTSFRCARRTLPWFIELIRASLGLSTVQLLCARYHMIVYITRCECFEFLEKGLVIDIMRTIAGERHAHLAVNAID